MHDPSFTIGNVTINPPTVLAPLAGITNLPFRRMIKKKGCGLLYSEMISANGLVYGSRKTNDMLARHEDEFPLSIQVFGSDPGRMAEASRMIEDAGADILDINFGCSVKKVVKTGAGVALMNNSDLAKNLLTQVRKAISIPLTIKLRSGWDASGSQAIEIAQIAQNCGVNAICLHPRTAKQGFSGKADWSLIGRMKKCITIPVIGNGDINRPTDALDMFSQTGCDGVMIGRAALSDPDIFRRTNEMIANKPISPLSIEDHFNDLRSFLYESVDNQGEKIACPLMRSRLGFLVKGLPGASAFRKELCALSTRKDMLSLIDTFEEDLMKDDAKYLLSNCEWVKKTGG